MKCRSLCPFNAIRKYGGWLQIILTKLEAIRGAIVIVYSCFVVFIISFHC